MSQRTPKEILERMWRRYRSVGPTNKRKLLDQAPELLSYKHKSAIRVLSAPRVKAMPWVNTGRPVSYEPGVLLPWPRPIWQATEDACGQRLAMLSEWIPACEAHERKLPSGSRDKMLGVNARALEQWLAPVHCHGAGRSLRRPGFVDAA